MKVVARVPFFVSLIIFAAELSSMRLRIDSLVRSQLFNPLDAFKCLIRSRFTKNLSTPLKRSTHPWPLLILSVNKSHWRKTSTRSKTPWVSPESDELKARYHELEAIVIVKNNWDLSILELEIKTNFLFILPIRILFFMGNKNFERSLAFSKD